MSIDLAAFMQLTVSRAARWHHADINEWSILEWAACMAGEAGEATNFAKKVRRVETFTQSYKEEPLDQLKMKCAIEVIDTIIYAPVVLARLGLTPVHFERLLREKFNQVSEEEGFPERL
jgi:hypothetical protein